MTSLILELRNVSRRFGGLMAVNGVSMAVERGVIHGLIGPNGAGKSTAFDLISGLQATSGGTIILGGVPITDWSIEARVAAGICRTFQTPKLFEQMTVKDVVMTGCHIHGRLGMLGSMFAVRRKFQEERDFAERATRLLEVVGLSAEIDAPIADLSYGKRRLVEIARALATEPKLLLLDEVSSGLNPVETAAVGLLIRRLVADGITVVLVEHDMKFVMKLCERITVLNFGSRIADGTSAEIANDEAVITAYLGRTQADRTPRRELRKGAAAQEMSSVVVE